MTHGRKHRRTSTDPMNVAKLRALLLTAKEVHDYMHPVQTCAAYLRQGVAAEDHHAVVYTALLLAQAIEDSRIMRGLQGHITTAREAIEAIGQRGRAGGEWAPPKIHFQEIEALNTMVDLHEHQIAALSSGELHRLVRKVIHTTLSTGDPVQRVQPEQLGLLAA